MFMSRKANMFTFSKIFPFVAVNERHIIYLTVRKFACKSAGGIVTAQSTAEDTLKMVVKKDQNM
jgi:hypothetical protein